MIYEFRTYNLKARVLADYHKRFAEKIGRRQEFSRLGGHWYTEIGPLNQMVAIWPYDSLEQRAEVRARVESVGDGSVWPPDTGDLITSMTSEIFVPAPFMRPLREATLGPIYELRLYTIQVENMPRVLERWAERIPAREQLSPLVGCWYKESGGPDNFAHMWAYSSFEERLRIRAEAQSEGIWPPGGYPAPDRQETKILLPASFSPMQ